MNLIVYPSNTAKWNKTFIRCAFGFGGISYQKKEGDSITPAGRFLLRRVFYRADRIDRPQTILPLFKHNQKAGWCDSPNNVNYNRYVSLPFVDHHEKLWRKDGIYDLIAVIGYNDQPIIANAGSAIFLHVATPDFRATRGCIAISQPDLLKVIEEWAPTSTIEIRISDCKTL